MCARTYVCVRVYVCTRVYVSTRVCMCVRVTEPNDPWTSEGDGRSRVYTVYTATLLR